MGNCFPSPVDVFDFLFFSSASQNMQAAWRQVTPLKNDWAPDGSKSIQHNLDHTLTPNSSNLVVLDSVPTPAAPLWDVKGSGSS